MLSQNAEDFSNLIILEIGKPIYKLRKRVAEVVEKFDYLGLITYAYKYEEYNNFQSVIVQDTYGVIDVISSLNLPCNEILLLSLLAIASGNTAIIKSSEVTEVILSILPASILQVFQGNSKIGS